ncbi:hypothetical protein RLOatenuis_6910 [Rickettsiales bacterium]|nr:hypothetical protein RLOatenuis_6910 [Rickettsiales bacterium]
MLTATIFSDVLEEKDREQWLQFCNKHLPPDLINPSSDDLEYVDDTTPLLAEHEANQNLGIYDIMQELKKHFDTLATSKKNYFCDVVHDATIGLLNSLGHYVETRFPKQKGESLDDWNERFTNPKEGAIYEAIHTAFPQIFEDAYKAPPLKEYFNTKQPETEISTQKDKDNIAEKNKFDFTAPPSEKLEEMFEPSSTVSLSQRIANIFNRGGYQRL